MSRLSSKWIQEFSTPPTFILTQRNVHFYTRLTLEQIEAINVRGGFPPDSPFYYQSRELSAAEKEAWKPLISPFLEPTDEVVMSWPASAKYKNGKRKVIPYGLFLNAYGLRLGKDIQVIGSECIDLVDPLNLTGKEYQPHHVADYYDLQAGETILGETVEFLVTAPTTTGFALPEQKYLEAGLFVQVDFIAGGAEGRLSICIHNPTTRPVRVYANQGIATIVFDDVNIASGTPMGE